MATDNKTLTKTYTLITSETEFVAQNRGHMSQEWVRAASQPPETLIGFKIPPDKGWDSSKGSGDLYARGQGVVVFDT